MPAENGLLLQDVAVDYVWLMTLPGTHEEYFDAIVGDSTLLAMMPGAFAGYVVVSCCFYLR